MARVETAPNLGTIAVAEIDRIEVADWSPQAADDPTRKPTELHLRVYLKSDPGTPLVLRLKGSRPASQLIEGMARVFKKIWGLRNF